MAHGNLKNDFLEKKAQQDREAAKRRAASTEMTASFKDKKVPFLPNTS